MKKQSLFDRLTQNTTAPLQDLPPSPTLNTAKKITSETERCLLDVYQSDNDIVVTAFVAGVHSDDLDISISRDTLTISGVRTNKNTIHPDDYYFRECYFGPFSRSIILPEDSGEDPIKATLKNGVLTIRVPKAKKKQITINTV